MKMLFVSMHVQRAFSYAFAGLFGSVKWCTMNKCLYARTKDTYPISIKLCDIAFLSISLHFASFAIS